MVYSTPCAKCDHRRVCGIKNRITECIDTMNDIIGNNDMMSTAETIFACPYTTSNVHQEAILAYKKVLQ